MKFLVIIILTLSVMACSQNSSSKIDAQEAKSPNIAGVPNSSVPPNSESSDTSSKSDESTANGDAKWEIELPKNSNVSALFWSADGKTVISTGKRIQVWDVETKALIRDIEAALTVGTHTKNKATLFISENKKHFAIMYFQDDQTIKIELTDFSSTSIEKNISVTLPNQKENIYRTVRLSDDGKKFAIEFNDRTADSQMWDVATMTKDFEYYGFDTKFSANGRVIAVSAPTVKLAFNPVPDRLQYWDLASHTKLNFEFSEAPIKYFEFSPTDQDLVITTDNAVYYRNVKEPQRYSKYDGIDCKVHVKGAAHFSPDGSMVAVVCMESYRSDYQGNDLSDYSFTVWNKKTQRILLTKSADRSPSEIAFSPDGRYLSVGKWLLDLMLQSSFLIDENIRFSYDSRYVVSQLGVVEIANPTEKNYVFNSLKGGVSMFAVSPVSRSVFVLNVDLQNSQKLAIVTY